MTELAVSVRFQAHSSILAGSAPAANYKPTRPLRYTLAQLTQESQCPTKPQPGEEKRFRLGSVSSFPEASSEGRGSNRDGSIRGCNGSEQDAPLCFFCSSLRHGSVFCILKVSSQCCTARLSCAERLSPGFSLVLSDSSLGGGRYCNTEELNALGKASSLAKGTVSIHCLSLSARGAGSLSLVGPTSRQCRKFR